MNRRVKQYGVWHCVHWTSFWNFHKMPKYLIESCRNICKCLIHRLASIRKSWNFVMQNVSNCCQQIIGCIFFYCQQRLYCLMNNWQRCIWRIEVLKIEWKTAWLQSRRRHWPIIEPVNGKIVVRNFNQLPLYIACDDEFFSSCHSPVSCLPIVVFFRAQY